jgi:hypothetical protein
MLVACHTGKVRNKCCALDLPQRVYYKLVAHRNSTALVQELPSWAWKRPSAVFGIHCTPMLHFVRVADSRFVPFVPYIGFAAESAVWAHDIGMRPRRHMCLAVLSAGGSIVQKGFVSSSVAVSAECRTALLSSFVMSAHTTLLQPGSYAKALMGSAEEAWRTIDEGTVAEGRKTVLTALGELPADVQMM